MTAFVAHGHELWNINYWAPIIDISKFTNIRFHARIGCKKVACPLSILSPSRPVLSCTALWYIRWILRPAALGLRYHRALCLGRQDDRIRRISLASNVKEPTRFMGTSWIDGSDKGHDSAIRSVFLFCYRMSTSATLCRDEKYNLKKFIVCQNRVFTTLFKW